MVAVIRQACPPTLCDVFQCTMASSRDASDHHDAEDSHCHSSVGGLPTCRSVPDDNQLNARGIEGRDQGTVVVGNDEARVQGEAVRPSTQAVATAHAAPRRPVPILPFPQLRL
jgi:hypothetical protein